MIRVRCPHCNRPTHSQQEPARVYTSAAKEGMFNDGPNLHEYTLMDGTKVREEVQAVQWSSGPCIFLKLVGKDVCFEWTQKEIECA